MGSPPFRFPTPVPGDMREHALKVNAAETRQIVEWFIERWAPGFALPPDSPLGVIVEAVRGFERGEHAPRFTSQEERRAWEFRFLALRRLQWSICCLHG